MKNLKVSAKNNSSMPKAQKARSHLQLYIAICCGWFSPLKSFYIPPKIHYLHYTYFDNYICLPCWLGLDTLYDPYTDIIVNLDGVDSPYQSAQRGAAGYGGATDWELLQIKLTPEAWSRTTWYLNGEIVPNPFQR